MCVSYSESGDYLKKKTNSFELLNNLLDSFKFVYITIHLNYF